MVQRSGADLERGRIDAFPQVTCDVAMHPRLHLLRDGRGAVLCVAIGEVVLFVDKPVAFGQLGTTLRVPL
jgi:hypothetical protein